MCKNRQNATFCVAARKYKHVKNVRFRIAGTRYYSSNELQYLVWQYSNLINMNTKDYKQGYCLYVLDVDP